MQARERWRKALHYLPPKVVEALGVFLDSKQPAFGFGARLQVFCITHANHQQLAFPIGVSADCFHHAGVLGVDSLEIQRAAFRSCQQRGYAVGGLGGGEVNHLATRRNSLR